MHRIISAILVLMTFVGILYAQGVRHHFVAEQVLFVDDTLQQTVAPQAPVKRKVDFMADIVKPYNGGGDSVICLVGNFAAHHNGAVIWCDSAVRYSDTQWGFFDRVVINQDSIFIYGDSAIYDGEAAHAEIYAPIVKVVDGDALLYTYNFSFNTQTKVGRYTNGGVLVHDDNILESLRGYYDAENHNIICVEQVELHGQDYDMKSDSIIYNTQTEFAQFFTSSEIWNVDGEYLAADEGYYDRAQDLYKVTRNGYILSEEQELWGDTLSYYRAREHIVGQGNIQMDDFKNKMMAFGDFAEYWSAEGTALLTCNPSAFSYDLEQSDSVFVRADSMWMITIDPKREAQKEREVAQAAYEDYLSGRHSAEDMPPSAQAENSSPAQSALFAQNKGQVALPTANPSVAPAQNANAKGVVGEPIVDSLSIKLREDSLKLADSIAKLPLKQRKAYEARVAKEQAQHRKAELKKAKAAAKKIKLDSIAALRQAKINLQLDKMRQKELERIAKDSVRRAERRAKLVAKGRDVSELDREDSLAALRNARVREVMAKDTLLQRDSVQVAPEQEDTIKQEVVVDSSAYRQMKAYRNVKMYRSDAQMICDSLVSNTRDSIIHLYINPVMWSQDNQLASTQVDVYTVKSKLDRAEFTGDPIMVAEIDTVYYNQVTGKTMTALFKDNEIYRNDVDGNVQTIYFQTESEGSRLVTEMVYLEAASASFYIEQRQLVGMTYRNDTPFTMYPLALIPASQPLKLQNFKWVPEQRPEKKDVFSRKQRPSQREQRSQSPRPTFSIVERMDREKERLIMSGDWVDREDQLTPELIQWRDMHLEQQQ